ncbi:MAG: TorF family putative porin [Burkholderiaceae bacterium]
MKKITFILSTLAACAMSASAQAQSSSDWTITGNAGLFSDYRFRGFTQTAYKPAYQGGFDVAHSSGFYVGNWNSNVEQALFRGASLELDFYGGYKMSLGNIGLDFGGLYYYYPTKANTAGLGQAKQGELYVGASYSIFTAKFSYGATNFFGLGDGTTTDTKVNYYLDLGAGYDLGGAWGMNGHYGYQHIPNGKSAPIGLTADNVSDYKIGVTKDLSGWVASASLIGTSRKNLFTTGASAPEGGGKSSLVLGLGKSF